MPRPLRLLLVVSLFLLPATAALALHRKTPASMEITHGQAGTIGTPRWGGDRFVGFDSADERRGPQSPPVARPQSPQGGLRLVRERGAAAPLRGWTQGHRGPAHARQR